MVIFIDESGTHKQSGHAANAVVYITLDDIEEVESQLRQIIADMDLESFHSVRKLRTVRDEVSQPGIQLADALAGLSRYHFENPNAKDAKKWFERLRKEEKLSAQVIF